MYLEIDEGFISHHKTIRFCALLQNTEAWSHIQRLWTWACRSCPTGDLTGMDPIEVELAMGWRDMDGRAYAAAVRAGFIDESEPGKPIAIHNWGKRTGASIEKMQQQAVEKKARRAHLDGKCSGTTDGCRFCAKGLSQGQTSARATSVLGHPPDDPPLSNGHLTQTRPDQTRPDQSPDQKTLTPAHARDPGLGERVATKVAEEIAADPDRPIDSAHDLVWRYRIRWEARHRAMWPGEKDHHVIARLCMEQLSEQGPERFAKAAALLPK